jgi:hypothetical protein
MAATLMPLALCRKWLSPLRRIVLGFDLVEQKNKMLKKASGSEKEPKNE